MSKKTSILTHPLSRVEVRSVDEIAIQQYGMTGLVLMENAGRSAAEVIDSISPAGEICILCGKGNNAGDGYVIARHLELCGHQVRVVSLVEPSQLTGDAKANYKIANLSGIPIGTATIATIASSIGTPAVIIDCLLGTGAIGDPREPLAGAIRYANELDALRIAIDLPSGLDCDTGIPSEPTFRAAYTLTFVAPKLGFAAASAAALLGQVMVLPIGIPATLLRKLSTTTLSEKS